MAVIAPPAPIRERVPAADLTARPRTYGIDNLRVAIIAGVIVCHVSASYAVAMPWYYEERTAGPVTQAALSALFGPGVLFAMAALFLVAGLLTPRSLERRGVRRFVAGRLLRLGIPLVASTLVLVPLTALAGALAEGETSPAGAGAFLAARSRDVDTGVMWFVAALLVFSLAYAAVRAARSRPPARPGPLRWWHLAAAGAAVTAGSYLVRLVWPALSVTPLHLSLWDWPAMATLFTFGVVAGERGWLDPVPDSFRRWCGALSVPAVAAAILYFAAVALTGDGRLLGGWSPQALAGPAIEGVLSVVVPVWLVGWFTRRWHQHGRLALAAGRGSYGAYVLHPLLIVLLAAAFRPVATAAEVKFAAVAALGVVASFALGWAATRVRPLTRVL